jgi:hypothetical protein
MKFPFDTQFTFESLTFATGEDGDHKMLPQGQRQSILLLHLHRVVPAQVQILLRGYTSVPSSSFGVFRS